MRSHRLTSAVLMLLTLLALSCTNNKEEIEKPELSYSIERVPDWTALFKREHGWFGGDGIFAIPHSGSDKDLSQGATFIFSDTMFGDIEDGELQEGFSMVHNSLMEYDGGNTVSQESANFLVKMDGEKPTSLFAPQHQGEEGHDYYWFGDGFVNAATDSTMYIFGHRIRDIKDEALFPFVELGTDLISIPRGSKFPYESAKQAVIPYSEDTGSGSTSYGVGVFENTSASGVSAPDGFIYVYGLRGITKELVSARVPATSVEDFSSWKFYDGADWSNDPTAAVALADSVSNEMSVSEIGNGKYALIYQLGGILPNIMMQVGDSPVGPFGERKQLWDTRNEVSEEGLFTYNAKAHPAISKEGELLISYNVNSSDFFNQVLELPQLYRPRFIRVTFNFND
ncbi:DUF4185 domain-containing protein [Roseivirga pacifica]|uniref:DUF4185 domain-containing protein n=1 Tax=Roseivirga pacifica TaxID=1267423 RepID=UPI003BAFF0AE